MNLTGNVTTTVSITTTEYECISGVVDVNCPPGLHSNIGLDIGLTCVMFILYCMLVIQFIIAPMIHEQKRMKIFRISLFVAGTFEFIFSIFHPISMKYFTNKGIGTFARILPWFVFIGLTGGYYILVDTIIDSISISQKSLKLSDIFKNNINRIKLVWLGVEALLVILIPIAMLGSLISRFEIFEDVFYWYQNFTVLFGGSLILIISLTIECKVYTLYKSTEGDIKKKFKKQLINLNIIAFIFAAIIAWSVLSVNNVTRGAIGNATQKLNWYAPYSNSITIIIHYSLVFLYLLSFMFYQWIPIPFCSKNGVISDDSIYYYFATKYCKKHRPQKLSMVASKSGSTGDAGGTPNGTDETVGVKVKTSKDATDDIDDDEDGQEWTVDVPEPSNTLYRLDSTMKKMSLNKITVEGRVAGKRGAKKPKKLSKKEAKKKRKENFQSNAIPTIENERKFMHDDDDIDTDEETNEGLKFLFTVDNDIANGIKFDNRAVTLRDDDVNNDDFDVNAKIELIIFEYDSVLSTQTSAKLKAKMENWTQARKIDLMELTLLFGGTERCKLLKKTFEKFLDLSDNLILFCLTEEWSQNVVNLFKKLKFEKYFASKVGKRTLSHVIGYDSALVKQVSYKKYLVILKLIESLDKKHENVLYISGKKDEIDNIRRINVCHSYHVKTRGMTESDINNILTKYFKH